MSQFPTRSPSPHAAAVADEVSILWAVVRTGVNREKSVRAELERRSIECRVPLVNEKRCARIRRARPLFPQVVFARAPRSGSERISLLAVPGVVDLEPEPVEDLELRFLLELCRRTAVGRRLASSQVATGATLLAGGLFRHLRVQQEGVDYEILLSPLGRGHLCIPAIVFDACRARLLRTGETVHQCVS